MSLHDDTQTQGSLGNGKVVLCFSDVWVSDDREVDVESGDGCVIWSPWLM